MKRILFGVGAVVAVIVIVVVGLYFKTSFEANKQNNAAAEEFRQKQNVADTYTQSAPVAEPGVYKEYDASLVASAKGPVLLFFHAPWCPQCRAIDADIQKNGLPDGVTVLKVDYDSSHELRKQYGVTLQTTFIKVNTAGVETGKYVAYNEPVFKSVEANLLN